MLTCESCGHELPTRVCPECQGLSPVNAQFCCRCGQRLGATGGSTAKTETGDPYDPEARVLCADESCIGIINEHGVCTECGRPAGQAA